MNPPTWAKNATPPPFAEALNSPKLASMSWYKNHSPRKIQAGIRTRKIGKTLNQAGDRLGPAQAAFVSW